MATPPRGWRAGLALVLFCRLAQAGPLQLLDDAPASGYRLTAEAIASPAALASGEVRLVVDYLDAEHYAYAELRAGQARFVAVDAGEARPLGTSGALWRGSDEAPLELSLQRSAWCVVLLVNRVEAARAERALPADSRVGWQVNGPGISLSEVALQPTDEIYFADDFMRTDDLLGGWEALTGRWENNQQGSKSSRSANAFSFRSVGDPDSLAVAGYPFWTDYVAQVAVESEGDGAMGLAVGVSDAEHYYRLRWTAASHPDGGTLRLQRVFGGQVADLAPPLPGGFRPKVWYTLQVAIAGGRLLAWLDREPLFDVAIQAMSEGQVGLWTDQGPTETAETGGALFDDVVVRSWPHFSESFNHTVTGRWQTVAGDWTLTSGPAGQAAVTGDGRLLTTVSDFSEGLLSADVRTLAGEVGLLLHADDDAGYALLGSPTGCRLVRQDGPGEPTVLAQTSTGLTPDRWHRLSLGWDNGLLHSRLDGVPLLEGFDLTHPSGRIGLVAQAARDAMFDNLSLQLRPTFFELPPQLPADFIHDEYMTTWAAPGAAWIEVSGSPARWHKGWFFGDREIAFSLPGFGEQTGEAELVLGATSTAAEAPALRLHLTLAPGKVLKLALRQGSQTLAEAAPIVESDKPSLRFELRSRFVLVWIDDECVLQSALPKETP